MVSFKKNNQFLLGEDGGGGGGGIGSEDNDSCEDQGEYNKTSSFGKKIEVSKSIAAFD